jgi:hypothetical protein
MSSENIMCIILAAISGLLRFIYFICNPDIDIVEETKNEKTEKTEKAKTYSKRS